MEERIATTAMTVSSSIRVTPRIRWELPIMPCVPLRPRDELAASNAKLVRILFTPERFQAAVDVVAHIEDLKAGRAHSRRAGSSAVGVRCGRREEDAHSRRDATLRERLRAIRDRGIVLIVQIGNWASIEDADSVKAIRAYTGCAGARRGARVGRYVGREQDCVAECSGGRQDFLACPAATGLVEQELPARRTGRDHRLDAGRYIDEGAVGVVNDGQGVILCLRQLGERLIVPNGIESILDRRVERMSAIT